MMNNRSSYNDCDELTASEALALFATAGSGSICSTLILTIIAFRLYAKNRRLARLQTHLIGQDTYLKPLVLKFNPS